MNKRNLFLVAIALVLAGVYAVYFTDWFKPKIIHITHTSRMMTRRRAVRPNANAGYRRRFQSLLYSSWPYKITEIKVVPAATLQTNNDAHPVWHLISDSNSVPVKIFLYGQRIQGMKFAVAGMRAEPLQPGVTYRLFVTDGSAKGQHDFQPVANPASQASPCKSGLR